jgi:2,4-dienoyl-CoA reductase (NADPH2)
MAKLVPGKEEFHETLRYFRRRLETAGVEVQLNHRATPEELRVLGFDDVIVATGVLPRELRLPGIDHPKVLSYVDVLRHKREVGQRVAIIGAGGIGFDVAEFLTHQGPSTGEDLGAFLSEWGVDATYQERGGLGQKDHAPPPREVTLCQRSLGKLGAGLGKTTGWIHRNSLDHRGVTKLNGVEYERIDDRGLHIRQHGVAEVLDVDNVIVCAGQVKHDELVGALRGGGFDVHTIGGAELAAELDAKRAIDQGTRLAASL